VEDSDRPMTTITVIGKDIPIPVDLAERIFDPTAVVTREELAEWGIVPGMGPDAKDIRVEVRPPGDYPDKYR
jgi:hypothetical protein